MLEQFNPEPDDTAELPATRSSRPVALIVTAAVVGVAILVGAGFLAFGNLGSGGGGGGIQNPGLPPAAAGPGSPGAVPAPGPTSPATTPVAVTTPSATGTLSMSATPLADVTIANAAMTPANYVGTNCPGATTGAATVIASGPVTITYRWSSTQVATNGGTVTYRFNAAGPHQFTHAFTSIKTPNGHFTASFVVVTPVSQRASMVYTQKCGASVSRVTAMTPVPVGMACTTHVTATLHAGVGPMTVRYHWVFKGGTPVGSTSGTWYVPRGGGRITVSGDVSHQQPVTAKLVVDSPVATQSAPTTASCP